MKKMTTLFAMIALAFALSTAAFGQPGRTARRDSAGGRHIGNPPPKAYNGTIISVWTKDIVAKNGKANPVSETGRQIVSPRDAASGQATGRRSLFKECTGPWDTFRNR
jgi:hypothetical protein